MFNGATEGIEGIIIEKLGSVIIFQYHEGKCELKNSELEALARWYENTLKIKSVYLKRFAQDRSALQADKEYFNPHPLWGEVAPAEIQCQENGMKLEIHPYDGFSTGIFLDQRNNRKFLSSLSMGKRVLNCFAYTSAFSVACALNQAKTTSVDLSRKYLEWGKRNFQHNQLSIETHEFYVVDVFEQFKKAKKLKKEYELIILDPPSFSRNHQGKVFSVKRDMKELIAQSLEILSPNGILFVSCNLYDSNSQLLENDVLEKSKEKKRKTKKLILPEIPFDFKNAETSLSAVCFEIT